MKNKKYMLKRLRKMSNYGIILATFTALMTGLTAIVHELTNNKIKQHQAKQKIQLINQVIPPSLYDNNILNDCYLVTNLEPGNIEPHRLYVARKNNNPIAVVAETNAPNGYVGDINLLVGTDLLGNILGVRVISHNETPGLGDKIDIRLSNWITYFNGKSLQSDDDKRWNVKKYGGMFDQFTGATITPLAVVNSVKHTVKFLKQNITELEKMPYCE